MNKTLELVDLGLPSGNLWFNCNLGAESKIDNGLYYQFGSLVGYQGENALKHSNWETCPFNDGKYNIDEEYFKANRQKWIYKNGILRPEFDVITQTFGPDFKIPEPKDFKELLEYCDYKYTVEFGRNHIVFKSKINNNILFFPNHCYFHLNQMKSYDFGFLMSSQINLEEPLTFYSFKYGKSVKTLSGYNCSSRSFAVNIRGIKKNE